MPRDLTPDETQTLIRKSTACYGVLEGLSDQLAKVEQQLDDATHKLKAEQINLTQQIRETLDNAMDLANMASDGRATIAALEEVQ